MPLMRRLFAVLLVTQSLLIAAPPARAGEALAPAITATITVNTFADEWSDDNPQGAGTACSLREALDRVMNNVPTRGCPVVAAGATVFNISLPAGTYVLSYDDYLPDLGGGRTINIDSTATIDGGKNGGRNLGIFRVVNATLNLTNLTLTNGNRGFGGAILLDGGTEGGVVADNVKFINNGTQTGPLVTQEGGAISVSTGSLTVRNSLFQGNVAGLFGGAVSTAYGLFDKVKFIGNRARAGGALYLWTPTSEPVEVWNSEFRDNKAINPDAVVPSDLDLYGGGAIANSGHLRLVKTLVQDNQTQQNKGGGGLWNHAAGTAVLEDCVFTKNKATLSGGGLYSAWGGAILNEGDLDIVRCSIHGNEADYAGAIFNRSAGADLEIFNSTISNNTAKRQHGGLVNNHFNFENNPSGGEVHLWHTTIGENKASGSGGVSQLYSYHNYAVWFSNSLIASGCNALLYSYGNSVMTGCLTEIDPQHGLPTSGDLTNTTPALLKLLPLTAGSAPVPQYLVQPIAGDSVAVDTGRDDDYGCSHPIIDRQDQNNAARTAICDAGAIEAGANPPVYGANPIPGTRVGFPTIDFTQGDLAATLMLQLRNDGGGAMTYEIVDLGGPTGYWAITNDSPGAGILFGGQQTVINFTCTPQDVGELRRTLLIKTNAPNQKEARYTLRCTAVGEDALASTLDQPGPLNLPATAPGQTAQTDLAVTNRGHQPLVVDGGLATPGGPWGTSSSQAAAGESAAAVAATLQPGQSLNVTVSCTPPGFGLFLNTYRFTTSDPLSPVIDYNLACEGLVSSPPEPVQPGALRSNAAALQGVAISPDGQFVLAGEGGASSIVRVYSRDQALGTLAPYTPYDTVSAAGMTDVYNIQYSPDGRNAYYTSRTGDGVVTVARSGNILSASQVLTTGTRYLCGVNNGLPVFCPIGTMNDARGLAVSPDGKYVYVTGFADGTLTVFSRAASDGRLGFTQRFTRTVNGVDVLGGAGSVAVSPDGAHVYVGASTDDTLAVFQRGADGRLVFQAAYKDGTGDVQGLNYPASVAVSPDGSAVYVTSYQDNVLSVFNRGSADGGLTLAQAITHTAGLWGVATSRDFDGERVYAAVRNGDTVETYARDPDTGLLSPLSTATHNVPPGFNLDDPFFFAVSPDDRHIYASLFTGQGVRLFQLERHAPVASYLSPASVAAGSGDLTLTVRGGRFYPDSTLLWSGAPIATSYVSENELRAVIPAALVASAGSTNVAVRNAAPGGGDSAQLPFVVLGPGQPAVPSIESVDPPEAAFGGEPLVVTITGAGFAPDSQVTYNQQPVPTVYLNDTTLQATLSAEILQMPGTGGLQVVNGGGTLSALVEGGPAATASLAAGFSVAPPSQPAAPAIASLAPSSVVSGSAETWISVLGHNFADSTAARWNGQARPTVVLNAGELRMLLSADDLGAPGNAAVTALTPGGGESAPAVFRVRPPGEKPVPVVTSYAVLMNTSPARLYVNGSDFDAAAQITINGAARPTTFVNSYQVFTPLPPENAGVITVTNPGPGGGVSDGLAFVARRVLLPLVWH